MILIRGQICLEQANCIKLNWSSGSVLSHYIQTKRHKIKVQTSIPLYWTLETHFCANLIEGSAEFHQEVVLPNFRPQGCFLSLSLSLLSRSSCTLAASLWACLYSRPSPLPPPLSPKIIFAARRFGLCVYWCSGTRKLFKCSARCFFKACSPRTSLSISACVLYTTQYMPRVQLCAPPAPNQRDGEWSAFVYMYVFCVLGSSANFGESILGCAFGLWLATGSGWWRAADNPPATLKFTQNLLVETDWEAEK